jgi:hypothetical protein
LKRISSAGRLLGKSPSDPTPVPALSTGTLTPQDSSKSAEKSSNVSADRRTHRNSIYASLALG